MIELVRQSLNSTFFKNRKIKIVENFLKENSVKRKTLSISPNLVKNYLSHNFNLLGSGLKNINLKRILKINYQNKNISKIILKNIDKKNYSLLDWQLDFKNNFRTAENIPDVAETEFDIKIYGRDSHLELKTMES